MISIDLSKMLGSACFCSSWMMKDGHGDSVDSISSTGPICYRLFLAGYFCFRFPISAGPAWNSKYGFGISQDISGGPSQSTNQLETQYHVVNMF